MTSRECCLCASRMLTGARWLKHSLASWAGRPSKHTAPDPGHRARSIRRQSRPCLNWNTTCRYMDQSRWMSSRRWNLISWLPWAAGMHVLWCVPSKEQTGQFRLKNLPPGEFRVVRDLIRDKVSATLDELGFHRMSPNKRMQSDPVPATVSLAVDASVRNKSEEFEMNRNSERKSR